MGYGEQASQPQQDTQDHTQCQGPRGGSAPNTHWTRQQVEAQRGQARPRATYELVAEESREGALQSGGAWFKGDISYQPVASDKRVQDAEDRRVGTNALGEGSGMWGGPGNGGGVWTGGARAVRHHHGLLRYLQPPLEGKHPWVGDSLGLAHWAWDKLPGM